MTNREKLVDLISDAKINGFRVDDLFYHDFAEDIADHLIANGVMVREPTRKAEDCRNYKYSSYGGVCLATKELDPCKGDGCERWKAREDAE